MTRPTTSLLAHSPGHAAIAVSALRAAGIPATLADDHFQQVYPGLGMGALRPRILVPPACEVEARAIIAQAQTVTDEPLYPCPTCGGETAVKTRTVMSALGLALSGRFSELMSQPRYCGDCDSYEDVSEPEPFTAEELGYPPIR